MKTIESPTAYLAWSLIVECPKCKLDIDLVSVDSDNGCVMAEKIFTNKWDLLRGAGIECPHCQHEFKIKGVEY